MAQYNAIWWRVQWVVVVECGAKPAAQGPVGWGTAEGRWGRNYSYLANWLLSHCQYCWVGQLANWNYSYLANWIVYHY